MEDSYPTRPQQETVLCKPSQLCLVHHTGAKQSYVIVTGVTVVVTQSVTCSAFRITHGMYEVLHFIVGTQVNLFFILQGEKVHGIETSHI